MDPSLKKKILDDLVAFRNSGEYYKRIGKSWKCGYLLYRPPGTGKSSLITAMANFLQYDIYNLELSTIKDNIQLNRLLQRVGKKSILVIKDIDCTLDVTLTAKRENADNSNGNTDNNSKPQSQLTLSGLLNSTDGLCSGCVQERIVVFRTNYVEKLDPALIRRGMMDMHVKMSYCWFEAFKVLARNYLNLESHPMFENIRVLLEEVDMSPADVAEILMPKCFGVDDNGEVGLEILINTLEEAKEAAAMAKAQEVTTKPLGKNEEDGDGKKGDEETESMDHNDEMMMMLLTMMMVVVVVVIIMTVVMIMMMLMIIMTKKMMMVMMRIECFRELCNHLFILNLCHCLFVL